MKLHPDDPHAVLQRLARADFGVFLRKAFAWVTGGDPVEWNWHFDAIVHQLDRVRLGECNRLLVNIAPRNGKSIAISVAWVAWMLGRDPKHRFVCVSYSNDLSIPLARQCLAIMQAPWYRELFPRTILTRTAAQDIATSAGGGRLATSVTGTLTGRGGDTIILDDLLKPQEADSEVVRSSVNGWYQSTLTSRLNDKRTGAIICVMQRLHEYDVAGLMIESGRYDVLSLPSIATADEIVPLPRGRLRRRKIGDALHPARESLAVLESIRAEMGSDRFTAQYLQAPVPATGNIIKAKWLRTFDPATVCQNQGIIVQSIDTANKANANCAFSVIITALISGKYIYILDVVRRRLEFHELRSEVIAQALEHKSDVILIEEQASGIGLISELRVCGVRGVPLPTPRRPEQDKVSRLLGVSAMVEAGQLLLPPDAPWLSEFKAEILGFPNGRYADQVDALSQLLAWAREQQSVIRTPLAGPVTFTYHANGWVETIGDEDNLTRGAGYYGDAFVGDPWASL